MAGQEHRLGATSTYGRKAVPKNAPVIETLGALEELEAAVVAARQNCSNAASEILAGMAIDLEAFCEEMRGRGTLATSLRAQGLEEAARMLVEDTKDEPSRLPRPELLQAAALAHKVERRLVAQRGTGGVKPEQLWYVDALAKLLDALAHWDKSTRGRGNDTPTEAVQANGIMEQGLWLCHTVMAEARRRGMRVVCAACDSGGNPVSLLRDEGAYIASVDIATNKAYTSVALQMPTEALQTLAAPGGPLYGIQHTNGGRIVIFAGGIPLYNAGGILIGGFGVSGGSAEEDLDLVHFARTVFEEYVRKET